MFDSTRVKRIEAEAEKRYLESSRKRWPAVAEIRQATQENQNVVAKVMHAWKRRTIADEELGPEIQSLKKRIAELEQELAKYQRE